LCFFKHGELVPKWFPNFIGGAIYWQIRVKVSWKRRHKYPLWYQNRHGVKAFAAPLDRSFFHVPDSSGMA
jgi:hypothetical protein